MIKTKPTPLQSIGVACSTSLICVNFIHPVDIMKTRMQVGNFNMKHLIKNEGITALWKGIQAAWFREAFYTSAKLGGYGPLRNYLGVDNNAPFHLKFLAGSLSGSIGSLIGNPFDVIKTQMMTNTEKRLSMRSLIDKIYRKTGIRGFYNGLSANITRAFILNGTRLACYDEIKSNIVKHTNWNRTDLKCQVSSAVGSGLFVTGAIAPFDLIRTRMMNQQIGNTIYNGVIDTAIKIYQTEGIRVFYRGALLMWLRLAPSATLQLVIFDNLLELCGFDCI